MKLTLAPLNQDLDDHSSSKYEQKWSAQIIEPKKTPDLENMDLEQYQVNNVSDYDVLNALCYLFWLFVIL